MSGGEPRRVVRTPAQTEILADPEKCSLKRAAWAYGCALKGSDVEAELLEVLVRKVSRRAVLEAVDRVLAGMTITPDPDVPGRVEIRLPLFTAMLERSKQNATAAEAMVRAAQDVGMSLEEFERVIQSQVERGDPRCPQSKVSVPVCPGCKMPVVTDQLGREPVAAGTVLWHFNCYLIAPDPTVGLPRPRVNGVPYHNPDGYRGPGWYFSDGVEAWGPYETEAIAAAAFAANERELARHAATQEVDAPVVVHTAAQAREMFGAGSYAGEATAALIEGRMDAPVLQSSYVGPSGATPWWRGTSCSSS